MSDGFEANGLQESWTPVALSRELGRRPRAVTVAGVRIALFRDGRRRPGALADRCPHRGVALSLGRVAPDGCLECPFHGWRFRADGACAAVPLAPLPDEKRRHLAAHSFAVAERAGMIWLYTGNPSEAGEPPVPLDLQDPSLGGWRHVETWRAHWTRAMENMLDVPHLPFVHRRTIGRAMRRRMRPDTALGLFVLPEPSGARVTWSMDGDDFGTVLRWLRPNGMELDIRMGARRRSTMHVWCVPEAQDRTRMIVATTRNFARWPAIGRLFDQFSRIILLEDRAIVESSRPAEVPPAVEERSVRTDRATLHFRTWYLQRVRSSRSIDIKSRSIY
ncbi:MAG TPA: aromatic ring-hydroxylating dioxygenase subunit alpha [Myxococcaceae bacterium]|jgi:phenylpropionate dioxygenase-like ring-hydroxylating dioxygenase large terminal subunit